MSLVAVTLPVLALFFVLVIEVGNWFEHRRHLQTQADAGVFAGAPLFNRCFSADAGVRAAGSDAIKATARRYAGDPTVANALNRQTGIGDVGTVTVRLNRKTFERGGPAPDDTSEDPVTPDNPNLCDPPEGQRHMLDLKLTEADVPWFLRPAEFLFAINAHARVEIQRLVELYRTLPVAIPDPNPRLAAIEFVNEDGGAAPCASPPCRVELQDQGIDASLGIRRWGMEAPFRVTVPEAGMRIGIRVDLGGETSTTCGEDFVMCHDLSDSNRGLVLLRGYSTSGSGAQPNEPRARGVWPTTLTCNGPSYFWNRQNCSVGVEAQVDFGTGTTDPTRPEADGGVLASLEASVGGSRWVEMTWTGGVWSTSPSEFLVEAFSGAHDVSLRWSVGAGTIGGATCTSDNSNPCTGTFADVQRVFSGDIDTGGSIRAIAVQEASGTLQSSYALPAGDHDLSVAVGTTYFRPATDPDSDETIFLRAIGDSARSQTFAIDCDPGVNFRDEITYGCATGYGLNFVYPGCPPDRTVPTPDNCVLQQPGAEMGQLRQGMNARFGCPPNNWQSYPDLPLTDVRIVPLILTSYGAFEGSGASGVHDMIPVRRFATFYVTGWDGGQSCAENERYPFRGPARGNIWGHFITHIAPPQWGRGDPNVRCDFTAIDTCIAVLTR